MRFCAIATLAMLWVFPGHAQDVQIQVDTSSNPELAKWCESARREMVLWHPRMENLLATEGFVPPHTFSLSTKNAEKGVGYTVGTRITVISGFVKRHPRDVGMVIHEMIHVIQAYPNKGKKPGWLVEGIADYARWAMYNGKSLKQFPRPKKEQAWKDGYQVTAGFLLWMESGRAPGIVRRLNTSLRQGVYEDGLWERWGGAPLPALWEAYYDAMQAR